MNTSPKEPFPMSCRFWKRDSKLLMPTLLLLLAIVSSPIARGTITGVVIADGPFGVATSTRHSLFVPRLPSSKHKFQTDTNNQCPPNSQCRLIAPLERKGGREQHMEQIEDRAMLAPTDNTGHRISYRPCLCTLST